MIMCKVKWGMSGGKLRDPRSGSVQQKPVLTRGYIRGYPLEMMGKIHDLMTRGLKILFEKKETGQVQLNST